MRFFKILLVFFLTNALIIKGQAQYYQQDKKLHIAAGSMLTVSTFLIIKDYFPGETKQKTVARSFKASLITVTAFAITKEILDYNRHKSNGTWNTDVRRDSFNDITITLLSGLTVSAFIPIVYR